MNGMANVIGGLIGYSIGHIHDNLPTYKFPFVIFGSVTIAWSVAFTFFTPANPTQAKWLTQREKTIAVLRLAENETGIDNRKFKMYQLREAFTDLKCWLMILIVLANCIPNVCANSLSTILKYLLRDPREVSVHSDHLSSTGLATQRLIPLS
jgi:MFS transporter, ACS family, allantoate permease